MRGLHTSTFQEDGRAMKSVHARNLSTAIVVLAFASPAAAQDPPSDGPSTPPASSPPSADADDSTPPAESAASASKPKEPKEKEGAHEEAEHECEPSRAGIDFMIGFGKLGGNDAMKFTAYSLLFGGELRLGDFAAGVRLPLTSATTTPDADPSRKQSQTALGNVEIAGAYFLHPAEHMALPIELAFALPTAAGDPSGDAVKQQVYVVQQTAAATRGFEDNALFMPKHLGVIPKVGLEYERDRFAFEAFEKFELLFKAGALGSDAVEAKSLGAASITGVKGSYEVFKRRAWVGLRAWAAYEIAAPYESKLPSTDESKFQMVFEPQIGGRIGPVVPVIGLMLPAGGRLGDPGVTALRIAAAVEM
jgi:hypothetical protein